MHTKHAFGAKKNGHISSEFPRALLAVSCTSNSDRVWCATRINPTVKCSKAQPVDTIKRKKNVAKMFQPANAKQSAKKPLGEKIHCLKTENKQYIKMCTRTALSVRADAATALRRPSIADQHLAIRATYGE